MTLIIILFCQRVHAFPLPKRTSLVIQPVPGFDSTRRRGDVSDSMDLLTSTKKAAAKEPPPSPTDLSDPTAITTTTTNDTMENYVHGKNCSESEKMAAKRTWRTSETLTVTPTTIGRFDERHHGALEHNASTTTDAMIAAAGHDPHRPPDSRKGAVKLLRVVTATNAPYRYAAVLYFWKTVSWRGAG